jgi:hypothetical protein
MEIPPVLPLRPHQRDLHRHSHKRQERGTISKIFAIGSDETVSGRERPFMRGDKTDDKDVLAVKIIVAANWARAPRILIARIKGCAMGEASERLSPRANWNVW